MAWTETGDADGEVVIFLHGYLGSAAMWADVVATPPAGYRYVCVDARGVGSSSPAIVGYDPMTWLQDVCAVADDAGTGRFTYVGHSLGGVLGYLLAAEYPQRLNRLICVCPGPAGLPRAGKVAFSRFRQAWEAGDAQAMRQLMAAVSVRPIGSTALDARVHAALAATSGHVDDLLDACAALDVSTALSALTIPTLVLTTAADPSLPQALSDYLRLPNAALHVMSGVGHVPQQEAPATVSRVVTEFLRTGVVNAAALFQR